MYFNTIHNQNVENIVVKLCSWKFMRFAITLQSHNAIKQILQVISLNCYIVLFMCRQMCANTSPFPFQPDEDLFLDRHPRYKNIIIGAGFSGRSS